MGLNDTYLLKGAGGKPYILRIYRYGWRTFEEIMYEIDVLLHLKGKGVPVSIPLPAKDGTHVNELQAPEGSRFIALFSYAPGIEPTYNEEAEAIQYGRAAAQLHSATDDFESTHDRFRLDLDHLIDSPLKTIKPYLKDRAEDSQYLFKLSQRLKSWLSNMPVASLEKGFCHGDLHGWNAGFAENGTVTLYDFDCCGFGWRAYDIAVFRWCARIREKELERWAAYLKGYQECRSLSPIDIEATSLFVGIRHIWLMGVTTSLADKLGFGWVNDAYFNLQLNFLHTWERNYSERTKTG